MTSNPVRAVHIAHPPRPHPVVWTEERVAAWRHTGKRPTVAVWTVEQFIRFLDGVEDDRLAGLWWPQVSSNMLSTYHSAIACLIRRIVTFL